MQCQCQQGVSFWHCNTINFINNIKYLDIIKMFSHLLFYTKFNAKGQVVRALVFLDA